MSTKNNKKNETPVVNQETAQADPLAELKAQLEIAKQALKDAKEKQKAEPKARKLKGTMVTFTNKAGETISGLGNLYYVVRQGGKLHYKEFSAVTVLEDPIITE